MHAIRVEKLTKYYKPRKVVDSITLQVKEGEIFGLLGKNGAGKSTLINMLTDISQPTSGEIFLFDRPLTDIEIKKKIGVLPDYQAFYGSLTPLEHLSYYTKINGKEISKEEMIKVLEKVGLGTEVKNKKVKKFSFGMKKKLGIAQAIITNPDLIILDEPTSGLDAEAVINIQHLIKELNAEGKTIFMTSHNLDEVEKICSKIAIMKEAKLMSIGTLEELQSAYQGFVNLYFMHLAFDIEKMQKTKNYIESITLDVKWEENKTKVIIKDETIIPDIIKVLVKSNMKILRMEVIEPSLEEIFLEKKTEQKTPQDKLLV